MKKTIRRKIIASAFAMGVAALTTTASTYAWFVSNRTVKTGTISGQVVDSNANLAIKYSTGEYGVTTGAIDLTGTKLKPLTINASNKFVDKDSSLAADGFVTFQLTFKITNGDGKVNKIALTKAESQDTTAANDGKYTAIADVEASSPYQAIAKGTEYKEDITKALMLSVYDSTNSTVTDSYYLNSAVATYDGNAYYNAVTGSSTTITPETYTKGFTAAGVKEGSGDFIVGSRDDSGEITVTFALWLDGTDPACWDAIASHLFTTKLQFDLIQEDKA